MKPAKSPRASTPKAEIAALVATLSEAERRLEELTGGEVDTVMSPSGSPFVLRRAQEELRQSESDRQASILNSLPAHVALLDSEGVIVTVNETWRQFALANHFVGAGCGVGVNYLTVCDEARGGNALEAPAVAQGIRTVLDGARSFSLEYPCHSPTEQRWFQLTASPLSQARSAGVVIMHVNVTGRKLAEQALRDSQTTMAAAQQIGHFGSWEVDLNQENDEDRNLLQWSDEMFHIAGYEPGAVEITNRFFFTLIPVEEHALIRDTIAAAIRERKTYTLVHRLIRADGSVRFLQEQAKIFFDETSVRPVKIIGTAHDITERMQADAARHQQQTELRVLVDLMPAMIWFKDTQNRILRVNQRVAENAGKPVEEIEGKLTDEIYPHEAAKYYADDLEVIRSGAPKLGYVEMLRDSAGRTVWIQTDKVPVRDKEGKVTGIVVMAQDITERKQAEEALLAVKKRLRDLLDGLGAAMMVGMMTPEGILVEANVPALAVVGLKPEDALGKPLVNSPWFAYSAEVQQQLRDAIARGVRGEASRYDMKIRGANGQIVDIDFALNPVRDEAGKIVFLVPSGNVITERKHAEEALRTSEHRFKALFDQAAVGVAQVDVQTGRYVQVNRRFCEIVGRSPEEMARIDFAEITHPQDMAQSQEMTRRMRAGLIREYTQEKRYVQAGRPDVWASVTVSVMWAEGETPDFFIAVMQDITQRKQMEEQVRQSQKMDAIGTLAGGIAHDFNNILAAIGGYTELARMTLTDNPGPRAHLGSVLQAVKRAADLVRQILTFSRQQPIERRAVELGPLVQETFGLLRATIPTTIEFELSLAIDAPTVLADVTQVHQILMNLGTNAWHAMKNRPGRLEVRLERLVVDETLAATQSKLHQGLYARVSVSDTGTGMDPITLSRIFDPFFTTKAPGEGTGLGLAVAQGIMDTHDGVITVESTLAVGTVFHVYFPAHLGQVAPTLVEISASPRGRGERILVVDDEESIAQMMQQALLTLGYAAEFATNPVAALDLVRADAPRFALVLTDLTMPGMTGLLLAARLRQIRPDLPIILMTGYSATLTAAHVKTEGLQDLLLKPASLPALASAVHAALVPQPPV